MQAGPSEDRAYPADGLRPGSPNRLGKTAVQPGRGDSTAELGHPGSDARDLADHDHGWARTHAVDVAPLAARLEGLFCETHERGRPLACIARRHFRTVASGVVARPSRIPRPPATRPRRARHGERQRSRRRAHDRRRAVGRGGRRSPGPPELGRLRAGTPGLVVADRPGSHRRPTHRVARGAHGPVPARRLAAGGDQPRTGCRRGRPLRDGRGRGRRGAGVGPRRRDRARRGAPAARRGVDPTPRDRRPH